MTGLIRKKRRTTKAFTVHVPKIKGISDEYWKNYIAHAVKRCWGNSTPTAEGESRSEEQLMLSSDRMQEVEVTCRRDIL
jgi:hypothetical protein